MAVKVIGLGNRLYGDDAIGSITAECIGALDAEANGFQALTFIQKDDIVIFIDAMMMNEEFGMFKIDINNLEDIEIKDPHRLSPIQIMSLAIKSENAPKEAYILGIKPEKMDWPGISKEVLNRIDLALHKYEEFLKKFGIIIDIDKTIQCIKEKSDKPWI
ncbi:hydrogenase maturation protease [Acidianus manzaensis]|uniref:Hydrogenase maturation protease n=1 Tax=Acidianus manzaensis TaxID=282676 RepID=A0A1W6JYE5_9CREN|nr:hydrogenase maturation protease [Acidianus manzaensis]ARM75289.1 hydrogenase maturation protease [Acidianus manzaensis]